jgi:hypothetical protein
MQVAQVGAGTGVERAEVAMGTAAELASLGVPAMPRPQMVIAVRRRRRGARGRADFRARRRQAVRSPIRRVAARRARQRLPVSLPGEYAVLEAHRAGERDACSSSDHVPRREVEQAPRAARGLY